MVKSDLSGSSLAQANPKVVTNRETLDDLECFLGYNNVKDAILVGVGKLGHALMCYPGFDKYGLNVLAGFDADNALVGQKVNGKEILPMAKLAHTIKRLNINLAILCTPQEHAQAVAELLANSGIRAILNFTSIHLDLAPTIIVKDEDIASELAMLAMQLKTILKQENE